MRLTPSLLFDLPLASAQQTPGAQAVVSGTTTCNYGDLMSRIEAFARALVAAGLRRQERVAVLADKSLEAVVALFGTALAGGVMVPLNPLLKGEQVGYILRDCDASVLVTTPQRLGLLVEALSVCAGLRQIVLVGHPEPEAIAGTRPVIPYEAFIAEGTGQHLHRVIDSDMAALLYTSGSTGNAKGVVLSHRNMMAGAVSVASYLENRASDRILAVLPLSFDYGFSQLTTAFLAGATAVLHNYLLAADVLRVIARERITGLAAVPPLWIQLTALEWAPSVGESIRYFTNSGGAMPTTTLAALRTRMPNARPYLMYGLTEAFRSTYLPPEEVDRRPTSMGKAIPNAEILVVREDGTACEANEPGELVHRGALVSLGYWNDPVRTAERFRPLPALQDGIVLPEMAVWSGDTVKRDEDGFLYFVGRRDEMIKSSGYRISPTEVEEVVYKTGLVAEVAALGIAHPALGQAIVLVARPLPGQAGDTDQLLQACRDHLPAFMMPARIEWLAEGLPRNANGKIDRKLLATARARLFAVPGDGEA